MDRFLTEVHKLHNIRATIKALSPAEHQKFVRAMCDVEHIDGEQDQEWMLSARDAQLPPRDLDWCWLLLGGRGSGKTHATSNAVHTAVRAGLKRIHLIGPTAHDLFDVNCFGPSGIMRTNGRDELPKWIPSKRRLEWKNGAVAALFSGEEPESLRGPQCIAAGTLIRMADGRQIPIDQIKLRDKIVTPLGTKAVLWQGQTRRNAPTLQLTADGRTVRLTEDHLVYVADRGWVEARKIKIGDYLIAYGTQADGGGVNARLAIIRTALRKRARVTQRAKHFQENGFTSRFTKTISALSRAAITFITWTTIPQITIHRILQFCRHTITAAITENYNSRAKQAANVLLFRSLLQLPLGRYVALFANNAANLFGTEVGERNHAFVVAGVGASPMAASIQNTSRQSNVHVPFAERFILPKPSISDSVQNDVIYAPPISVTVNAIEPAAPIDCYDLAIQDAHCFFAGDLLVHNCEMCIIDEIARMREQEKVFHMAMMGLRLGDFPRMLIATTPRPTPFIKKLVKMNKVSITSGSTFDNAKHLSAEFLKKIRELYEGTRLGRQELLGTLILDPQNALFKEEWLQHDDLADKDIIEQTSVGVDPSGGGDEVGIVVGALLTDGRLAVLADRTLNASPGQWGDEVMRAYDEFDCDDVVVEVNFGGAMATEVIKAAADRAFHQGRREHNMIRIKEVNASRGKVMRAEPISLQYERGRVIHRKGLDPLEGEMLAFSREWDRAVDGSPNRLDAAIWVLTRLGKIITDMPIA